MLLELAAGGLVLPLELLLQLELLLLGGQLDLLGLVRRLDGRVLAELLGLLAGAGERALAGHLREQQHSPRPQHQSDQQHQGFGHDVLPLCPPR